VKSLVVGEVVEGKVQNVTYELVSCAKEIGDYVTLVIGNADVSNIDGRVVKVDAGETSPWHYRVVEKVVEIERPDLVLIGNTPVGIDIASQLSTRYPTAVNIYEVNVNEEIRVKSVTCGGKVTVELKLEPPAIVVVNAGSYDAEKGKGNAKVEELSLRELGLEDTGVIDFVNYVKPPEDDTDISEAEVVVSVGRGVGDELNIELAEELAELLNGVVAGSRPVIDLGWLPKTRQVGRSGKTVRGKLYVALGISGATEHVEGVKARKVVAVNIDKSAPIFRISDYGVIADVNELLPALVDRLRKAKNLKSR